VTSKDASDPAMTPMRKRTIEISEEYWAARENQSEHVTVAQLCLALARTEIDLAQAERSLGLRG
jgi:hypothetical protein